jgi:hypothetical protein
MLATSEAHLAKMKAIEFAQGHTVEGRDSLRRAGNHRSGEATRASFNAKQEKGSNDRTGRVSKSHSSTTRKLAYTADLRASASGATSKACSRCPRALRPLLLHPHAGVLTVSTVNPTFHLRPLGCPRWPGSVSLCWPSCSVGRVAL